MLAMKEIEVGNDQEIPIETIDLLTDYLIRQEFLRQLDGLLVQHLVDLDDEVNAGTDFS
jgi:hypothetical protein